MKLLLAISFCAFGLTPAALGQLFSDDFNNRTTLPPWTAQSGNWTVSGGVMTGGTNSTFSYGFAYITNSFSNYSVQAQFQFPAGAYGGGLGGRLNSDSGSHYAAWVYPENSSGGSNVLKLLRFDSYSSFALLRQTNLPAVGTGSHTVKLEFSGSLINVYFDSNKLLSATDATYASGSVSLDMWTHDTGYQMTVDNVVANALPLLANDDNYAAIAGTPLTVAAPGVLANDSGGSGPLSAVLVTSTMHGSLTLNSNGGFTYTATAGFTGVDSFTYQATDGLTNSADTTVTISVVSVLFSDSFTRSNLSPWVVHSGNWAVTNDVLRGGPNTALSYGIAYITNQWDFYSVQASIQLPAGAFGAGLDACLDPATGARYAAWIYPEGSGGGAKTLKLIKFQDWENFTLMQQTSLPSVGTTAHTLKLDCAGNQISVYFDGALRISATDSTAPYLTGGIAVDLWTDTTGYQVSVDDVLVEPSASVGGLSENFDGVTSPALPSGWTAATTDAPTPWFTTNSPSDTVPNSVFCPDAAVTSISELVSPVFVVPAGPPQLVFRNYCSLETGNAPGEGYDGGVLEIKIGAGAFTDILAAGGSFVTNGYTHTLSTLWGNPLGGREAWSGRSNAFSTVIVNLPVAAVGQAVQLRWRCATDEDNSSGNGGTGWRIDTVAVKMNSAPELPAQADRTILELTTLTVTNSATDADVPADTLTYSLLTKPTTATISASGVITWTPNEAEGPSTNIFTTRVVDNGTPPLSATNTFTVVVNESNTPPVLPAQVNRTIAVLTTLAVTNTATDSDVPANTLTYSLPAGPTNATIDTDTGVITWTPTLAQDSTTNLFTTVVTDSNPSAINAQNLSATNSFTVVAVTTPVITLDSSTLIAEGFLPTNNLIDPGETVTLLVGLRNMGASDTTNLVATLLATNGVTFPSAPQTYGLVPMGGGVVSQPFTFTASGSCGDTVTPTLQLQDGSADRGTVAVSYTMGQAGMVLTQNFDSVTAPALPAGWTASSSGAESPWVTRNSSTNDTAPNAAYAPNPASVGISDLVSPSIAVPLGESQLTFRHNYSLEADEKGYFDGGVLEIQIGAGSFTDILAAGGSFISGGYNGTISMTWLSPIAGRQAWSSNSVGFITTAVNLPVSAAGQNIRLRWRCATDYQNGSGPTKGWYVDSIALTGGLCATNYPPALPVQAGRTISELSTLSVTNTATDPQSPPQELTYSLVSAPLNAAISTNGIITWTPTEDQGPGDYTFKTLVSDNALPSASATNSFNVRVNEVNSAPSLTLPADATINELALWTANASASDTDAPPNTLTFELVSGPAGLSVSPAGVIGWTPTEAQGPDSYTVTARVFDNGSPTLSTTNSFTLTVDEVNSAPSLTLPADQTIIEQVLWTASASATDPDTPTNTLTLELVSGPAGLTVSPAGLISWTPQPGQSPSTNTVTARVFDNGTPSLSDTNSFDLVVLQTEPEPQPVIQAIGLSNGVVSITWTAVTGRTYRVEYRADVVAGTIWSNLPPDVTAANSTATATNAVGAAAQGFYRVRLLP